MKGCAIMSIRKRESKKTKNGIVYEVYFNYKENGITRRYSKSGFLTKKEAADHQAMMLAELQDTGKINKKTKKTFKQVYEEFLEVGASQYQPNTIYNTKRDYNQCKELADIPITNFDYPLLQKFFNSRKDKGMETNKNVKKAINRILNYAIKVDYIKSNPLNLVTVTGIENHMDRDEILEYNDFILLITALNDFNDFKLRSYSIAIQIGYYTGLRVSEILALEKDDFLIEDNLINIHKKLIYNGLKKSEIYAIEKLKSKKSKSLIPLAKPLKDEIIKWFKDNPYEKVICDEDGQYIHPDIMSAKIKDIGNQINISFHFHMLRHTFATNIVMSDIDLKTAQELMRHSNINTTMSVYTHINSQRKVDAINDIFKTKSVEKVSNKNSKIKTLN